MARRTRRPGSRPSARPRPGPPLSAHSPCPCGLPAPYGECCGPRHDGRQPAATAEQLMRARYSAYAAGDRDYLLRTWHPEHRPASLELDGAMRWTRLEVVSVRDGGVFHREGTVAFRAHYRVGGADHVLQEHSRFVRHEGAWVYTEALPGR